MATITRTGLSTAHIPLLTLFLTITLGSPVPGPESLALEEIQTIEHFTGDVMACANIPGLALGIIRGGATFETGLGNAHMETGHPVDKRTIFNLGSTAKAFVPYVLAELMNGKDNSLDKISWNHTLRDIVHHHLDVRVPSPWGDMTLREMLIYPSGSSAADLASMAGLPEHVDREEIIRRLRFLPQDDSFRSSNHFSNIMYTVASHLAERLSQMTWSELVKVRVFDKQNMNASSFAPGGMEHEDAALPYRFHATGQPEHFVVQDKSLFDLRATEPVGSLMASADDVTKWLRHMLYSINAKGSDSGINHLIKDAFISSVASPVSKRSLASDKDQLIGYGMGWYMSKYRDFTSYKYRGSLFAYNSQIWLFPELQAGIFIAINGPDSDNTTRALDGIMYHVSDTVLKQKSWVTKELLCHGSSTNDELKNSQVDDVPAPLESQRIEYLAPLEKYIGSYGNGIVGDLIVEANGAKVLEMKLGQHLDGHLTPDGLPANMKFLATGPLFNTAEWSSNKSVEFVKLHEHSSEDEPFDAVRLHVNEVLIYEFVRGTSYRTILQLAEEADEERIRGHSNVDQVTKIVTETGGHETEKNTEFTHHDHGEEGHNGNEESVESNHRHSVEHHNVENIDPIEGSNVDHGTTQTTDQLNSHEQHGQVESSHHGHTGSNRTNDERSMEKEEEEDNMNHDDHSQDIDHPNHSDHSQDIDHPNHSDHSQEIDHPNHSDHLGEDKHSQDNKSSQKNIAHEEGVYQIDDSTPGNGKSADKERHRNIDNDVDGKPYDINKGDSQENDINSSNDIVGHQSHEPYSDEQEDDVKNRQDKTAESEKKVKAERRKNQQNSSTSWHASMSITIVLAFFVNLYRLRL